MAAKLKKEIHPGTIPAMFGLIWFNGFRGEDLNVIFYQNMPNLHNRYKSAERKISHSTKHIHFSSQTLFNNNKITKSYVKSSC
jgi:hypothetical protein